MDNMDEKVSATISLSTNMKIIATNNHDITWNMRIEFNLDFIIYYLKYFELQSLC